MSGIIAAYSGGSAETLFLFFLTLPLQRFNFIITGNNMTIAWFCSSGDKISDYVCVLQLNTPCAVSIFTNISL